MHNLVQCFVILCCIFGIPGAFMIAAECSEKRKQKKYPQEYLKSQYYHRMMKNTANRRKTTRDRSYENSPRECHNFGGLGACDCGCNSMSRGYL